MKPAHVLILTLPRHLPLLYTYFCLGGREWLMGCVSEDPSSGELRYHFLIAVLSTHERWTELLCPEGVLGTEESIVEINPEDFANHPEPELALPPNRRNVEKQQLYGHPTLCHWACSPLPHTFVLCSLPPVKTQPRVPWGVTFSPMLPTIAALKKCLSSTLTSLVFCFNCLISGLGHVTDSFGKATCEGCCPPTKYLFPGFGIGGVWRSTRKGRLHHSPSMPIPSSFQCPLTRWGSAAGVEPKDLHTPVHCCYVFSFLCSWITRAMGRGRETLEELPGWIHDSISPRFLHFTRSSSYRKTGSHKDNRGHRDHRGYRGYRGCRGCRGYRGCRGCRGYRGYRETCKGSRETRSWRSCRARRSTSRPSRPRTGASWTLCRCSCSCIFSTPGSRICSHARPTHTPFRPSREPWLDLVRSRTRSPILKYYYCSKRRPEFYLSFFSVWRLGKGTGGREKLRPRTQTQLHGQHLNLYLKKTSRSKY